MGTCGDCKSWGVIKKESGATDTQSGDWRQCGRFVHDVRGDTEDWRDGFENDSDEKEKARIRATRKELAVVQDGSGYFAALKSRADFGCVMFEHKESA